ncbi:MAG: hypothetical protein IPH04_01595 [Saprospirales bacterium]|nr:hypothetical protein [Saprospirales bacterium]
MPCNKRLRLQVGGMLVFKDIEHFEKCALCLEYDYDAYNDQYDGQYPNATPEELDSMDVINNFDQWTPYLEFEDDLSFSSLRAKIEEETMQWLASTHADSIDFGDDPNSSTPLFRTSYRALLNEDGLARVGADTIAADDWEERGLTYNCDFLLSRKHEYNQINSPELENRMIIVRVTIMSGVVGSALIGHIHHYKKIGNNFKLTRANLRLAISGRSFALIGEECDTMPQYWSKFNNTYKNRTYIELVDVIWGLWREAFVNSGSPIWQNYYCVADGYWNAEYNWYPSYLAK